MDTILTNPQMVVEDRQRHLFRVSRRAFTDQSVLEAENRNIFDRCWLYLGHSSEIANNCDFITRNVGGRRADLQPRPRRRRACLLQHLPASRRDGGAREEGQRAQLPLLLSRLVVQRERPLRSRFEEGNYGTEHYGGGCADLAQVPRLESHRDFWFVNFDRNAVSLADYLAGAKEYIDIVADHAEAGMEIVGSGQQYIINANWKLLAENSIDAYHGFADARDLFRLSARPSAACAWSRRGASTPAACTTSATAMPVIE